MHWKSSIFLFDLFIILFVCFVLFFLKLIFFRIGETAATTTAAAAAAAAAAATTVTTTTIAGTIRIIMYVTKTNRWGFTLVSFRFC